MGTQKHRTLTWGQFQCVTNLNSQDILRFTSRSAPLEVRFCHGHGGPLGVRVFNGHEGGTSGSSSNGSIKRHTLPFDCVEVFNFYARLRPVECRGPDEPLYLCPDPSWDRGGPWFKPGVAGTQLLSRIPRLLGIKHPRDQPPPPPATELQPTSRFTNSTHMQSLTQLRENFLASMNSFIAEKITKSEDVHARELPPSSIPLPFLSPQGPLIPENLSLLAAGITQFPQSSLEDNKTIPRKEKRGGKPARGWDSPTELSMDGSADDTSASSPKSLPAPLVDGSTKPLIPEHKPTLTP